MASKQYKAPKFGEGDPYYLTPLECRIIQTALKQYRNNSLTKDNRLNDVIANLPEGLKP